MSAEYTGRLQRAPDGTISGYLVDVWNWRINITAEKDPDGGYRLVGVLGEIPDCLRIPLLDGEKHDPS